MPDLGLYMYDGIPLIVPNVCDAYKPVKVGDMVRTNTVIFVGKHLISTGIWLKVQAFDPETNRIGIYWDGEPLFIHRSYFDVPMTATEILEATHKKEIEMLEEFYRCCGVDTHAQRIDTCTCTTPTDAERYTPKRILKSNNRNKNCTIVFWEDGTKTIVKQAKGEPDNDYSAFTAALAIKIFGTNSNLRRTIKRKLEVQVKKPKKNEQLTMEDI